MSHRADGLGCVLVVASAAALCACTETVDARYSIYADAQAAGALRQGWLPEWTPAGAFDIREAHNLDTNAFMVRFVMPLGTRPSMPAACEPVALGVPPNPPFHRSWWPSDVPASGPMTHRHAFFACQEIFVAVSGAGEVLVWRTPK